METTKNVKMIYTLSAAGQKLAVLAGRPAQGGIIEETVQISDEELNECIEYLRVNSKGDLELEVLSGNMYNRLLLDQPPTIKYAIAVMQLSRIEYEQRKAEERAKEELQELAKKAAIEANYNFVEKIISTAEAGEPDLSTMPEAIDFRKFKLLLACGDIYSEGSKLDITVEHKERIKALQERSRKDKEAKQKAEQQAKEAAIAMVVANYGGYHWHASSYCDFKGYEIWRNGQTKRWAGIFTQMRGIDTFLNSPRGEHVFDVSQLKRGDCIQVAGYDTNSRGKRRNESEWFGIVLANDDNGLVVLEQPSRGACLVSAKNLK